MSTRSRLSSERGVTLIYMAIFLTTGLLFTGLAVDSGRAYVVKAQLTKAVDGAALAAARNLHSGDPEAEAARIFKANFPAGYLGTSTVTDPTTDPDFFQTQTIRETGVNIVTVQATAVVPTTFMRLANLNEVRVHSSGEAQRRMVDLSLVLDVSGSIGSRWDAVRAAAVEFINAFDESSDRLALVTYGNGVQVRQQMPSTRGFSKSAMTGAIPTSLPGGWTPMGEGIYRGWDELRSVPIGSQSGLRVIVLFTDGSANGVPGFWDTTGIAKSVSTSDFPERSPDPDNITTDTPQIQGLYDTQSGNRSPSYTKNGTYYTDGSVHMSSGSYTSMSWLPPSSAHTHHRSAGIPTSFPFQSSTLRVDGGSQTSRRGLMNFNSTYSKYPAHVRNIRNAATNLVEIVANAARSDEDGDQPIRIFTIGMGNLVRMQLGSRPETSESVLIRIANDRTSPDFNNTQMEGKYYFAQTEADVGPAFQQLQNQIVRLSK
jgi:Flp pilus assembly protein TadG